MAERLEKLRGWFDNYVAGFYGDDEFINANIKLKEEHSRRTCSEMLYLAEQLGLDAKEKQTAEAAALLHDIGRFEQFAKYRTYNDTRSVNHCLLGVDVLTRTGVLDDFDRQTKQIIEKAIEYHGAKELPRNLDGRCLLLSQMLRDADKLDIFRIVVQEYARYRANPDEFELEVEFPDRNEYCAEIVQDILKGQRIDYGRLRTLNDMKLLQVGWVYDVNFVPTLERIKERKFLESLVGFLPETADVRQVRDKIFEYVDSRIQQGR